MKIDDISLGNLLIFGSFLKNQKSFNKALEDIHNFLNIKKDKVLNVTNGKNLYLYAILENGKIIESEDELVNIKKLHSATAIVNVKKDSFFVQGHFPGEPVMPGVLIVEAFGQAAAALTAAGIDKSEYENKLVFLMSVEKARFRNPVVPDCKLELYIEAIRSHGKVWKYKGVATVEGKKMADAQWSATIVDRK